MQEMSSDEEPGGVGMDEMDEMVACGVKSGHNEWCIICWDGSSGHEFLPPLSTTMVSPSNAFLATWQRKSVNPQNHTPPTLDSTGMIYRFCPLSSQSVVCWKYLCNRRFPAPVVLIHLALVNYDTSGRPFNLAFQFLSPYFPSGGIAFHELIFDVASKSKSDHYQLEVGELVHSLVTQRHWPRVMFTISNHTYDNTGDPFLGHEHKKSLYVSGRVDSFLNIILTPWQLLIKSAKDSYLWLLFAVRWSTTLTLFHTCKHLSLRDQTILHQTIKGNEEVEEREAACHPREATFYKKTLSEWDVTQKLFKQEINEYDKAEQERKGLEHSIKYQTLHAWEWFDKMTASQKQEVKSAMEKWNREGAPEESQAVHESEPQNAKKRFLNDPRPNFVYPSEGQDHADAGSDNGDDDSGPVIPEVILDEDGYAKLPMRDGIGLKGQHELIRSIFHASYKVCTGGSRPVPWGTITGSSSNYLESGSVPTGFMVKDPSHMKTEEPNSKQHTDLPIWADWSWNGSFLPEDVHISYDTLKASLNKLITSPITGAPSAMPVVLGIGLLYRESKRVMKFEEDEAKSNTPAYLPGSVFDLQFLVALDDAVREVLANIIEHIERLTKNALSEDDDVEDNGVDGGKEVAVNQESSKVGEDIPMQQMEIQEKQEEEQEELEE
ncbi:uncharacterized protein EDB93DRAFT_1257511, partial [Suillus bovinus]|uniref:uncharacterized protein n=1 Tax=Suillus bovinus TaxID=48563 RepID=UPI001B86E479